MSDLTRPDGDTAQPCPPSDAVDRAVTEGSDHDTAIPSTAEIVRTTPLSELGGAM